MKQPVCDFIMGVLIAVAPAAAIHADGLTPPPDVPPNSTFCNPLNLGYCFTPYGWNGREGGRGGEWTIDL